MTQPLVNGAVVKIWHGTRGHDYVFACIDRTNKKIGLIKHTAINQDGSIHAAVTGIRKWINYEELAGQKIVPKVARVVGVREVDNAKIQQFLLEIGITRVVAVSQVHNVIASNAEANDTRRAAIL